jgi:hypothetical protein
MKTTTLVVKTTDRANKTVEQKPRMRVRTGVRAGFDGGGGVGVRTH